MSHTTPTEHSQSKMTAIEALDAVLAKIQRYDERIDNPGCDCCSPYIDRYAYDGGDLVLYYELEHLINTLKAELTK